MQFEHIFKLIVGSAVGLAIAGYSAMTKDVVRNTTEIKQVKKTIMKMDKKVEEIHWFLLKSKK
tara:strand:+ start:350 stop:538 length:189 start_codon:yes stop_codon:yes gene_type:complete